MTHPKWLNHADGPVTKFQYNEQAYEKGYGLLHWGDKPTLEPDYYGEEWYWKAKSEINSLNEAVEKNILTLAYYNPIGRMAIGKPEATCIIPATKEKLLEPIEIEPYGEADLNPQDYQNVFKALRFDQERLIRVTPKEAPILFDPDLHIPHWAACNWKQIEREIVESVYQQEPLPYEASSLTPTKLEICAEEYLRLTLSSFRRVSKLGVEQKDVDVIGHTGLNQDKLIMAEMTQGGNDKTAERQKRLEKYADVSDALFLFAPRESKPSESVEDVTFVATEEMFDELDGNKRTSRMLDKMLMQN